MFQRANNLIRHAKSLTPGDHAPQPFFGRADADLEACGMSDQVFGAVNH